MKRRIIVLLAVIVLAVLIVFADFLYSIFKEAEIDPTAKDFEIASGQSVKQITASLDQAQIIKSKFWFRTYVWLKGNEKDFIAGKFDLPDKISASKLVSFLTNQARKDTRLIKIIEGWSIKDIVAYFENQGIFSQEEVLAMIDSSHEGYLFPDTYEIFADADLGEVIGKMRDNFEKKVDPAMRSEVERQGKEFYDVLIMASIIEAEVPDAEDRAIVSDIFWSRLAVGVALQSDATLNYDIDGKNPRLTAGQLKIDSPYNTYLYRGLPPTPIGNPGLSAIKAAIYPQESDYFYFLSTPEGETIFSRTLEEHNRAKAQHYPN